MPPPVAKGPARAEVPCYRFAMTWNRKEEWDEKDFSSWDPRVTASFKSMGCKQWIFQLERGAEGRLHYQAYFKLATKKRLRQVIKMVHEDLEGAHVSEGCSAGDKALSTYCMKEDTRVQGPWADKPIPRPLPNCDPLGSYDPMTDPDVIRVRDHPRPFQEELTKMCLKWPADGRKVIWVFDKEGESGKNDWLNFMEAHHGAKFLTFATSKDLMDNIYKDIQKREQTRRIYIINLPRSKPKDQAMEDMFNVIEMLKDGRVFNTKGMTGGDLKMHKPHVVVLSNWLPERTDSDDGPLSKSRWALFRITRPSFLLAPIVREHVTGEITDFFRSVAEF